jgi:acyl carrier protein
MQSINNSMQEKIYDIIANQLGCDRSKITLESHLIDDLGADSLNAIEIVMDIENEFGITIDDKQVESISKVKDIVALVESK